MKSVKIAAMALVFAAGSSARADMVWTGSAGERAASVSFAIFDTILEVTLTNTSSADAVLPDDILSVVYFNIAGAAVALSPESAILAAGAVVHFGAAEAGGIVGGEWAYRANPLAGFSSGISSSAMGAFGSSGRFPGSNLEGPEGPGGLDYGLTTAGDNPSTGHPQITGSNALIQGSVVFRLSGLPADFDLGRIDSVRFQYGGNHTGPSFAGVPAPGSAAAFALAGFFASRRRRLA